MEHISYADAALWAAGPAPVHLDRPVGLSPLLLYQYGNLALGHFCSPQPHHHDNPGHLVGTCMYSWGDSMTIRRGPYGNPTSPH